jgi:RNA polymerase sigma-70 factor (ECF subfamily)
MNEPGDRVPVLRGTVAEQSAEDPAILDAVAAFADGDAGALAVIYARYHEPVRAFIARRIDDPGEAEGVAHEVFLRAIANSADFRAERPSSFGSWLFVIARNCAIDRARERRRVVPCDPSLMASRLDELGGRDDEGFTGAAGRAEFERLLRGLPKGQRHVLALRYLCDLPDGRIARSLHMSEDAVRRAAFQGLQTLRKRHFTLAENGVGRYGMTRWAAARRHGSWQPRATHPLARRPSWAV